jgi:hypothetical protein
MLKLHLLCLIGFASAGLYLPHQFLFAECTQFHVDESFFSLGSTGNFTSPDGVVDLSWIQTNNSMIFTLTGHNNGWVGIGINSAPQMAGADLLLAFVNSGTVQVSES